MLGPLGPVVEAAEIVVEQQELRRRRAVVFQNTDGGRELLSRYPIRVATALAVVLSAQTAANAQGHQAQAYPSRPVKIIVPFPAGGTADVMPRIFSEWLARKWNEPVVIENRAGAGGNIGAEAVARSEPDGYTLLAAPPPPLVINQNLYPKLGYDPTEFSPIVIMGRVPNALVVNPKLPATRSVRAGAEPREGTC